MVSSISVIIANTLISSVNVVSCARVAEVKGVSGHWLMQHTAPVRAKLDDRPRLEGAHYKYPASCSLPTDPTSTLHVTHTLAHTYQFPSSPWASALDHYEVSALRSRVGWTSARNNE